MSKTLVRVTVTLIERLRGISNVVCLLMYNHKISCHHCSHNGKYIICGSEDHFVYIWKTHHEFYKFSSARRDRNVFWEGIKGVHIFT